MGNANLKAGQAEVGRLIAGYMNTQLVYLAAKLGIADLLAEQAYSFAELASLLAVNPQILRHVLRGFVVIGLLQQNEDSTFGLTALGACLKTGAPGELRQRAMVVGELFYPAWGGLNHMLQTGESAFESIFQQSVYDYLQEQPETMTRLQTFLQSGMSTNAIELLAAYDFTPVHTLVDIGGGMGVGLTAILQAYPQTSGILFDLPSVVAEAEPLLAQKGLTGRYQVMAGDFFATIPAQGDLFLLSRVLHNWTDEQCIQILRNCQTAMHGDQKLLIVEQIMPEVVTPELQIPVRLSLLMLIVFGGYERTLEDYRQLLGQAGLTIARVLSTNAKHSIIEVSKQPVVAQNELSA